MKHFLSITLIAISTFVHAQAPQLINYQGVTRDGAGAPVANSYTLTAEIKNTGVVYTETHAITTNSLGLFNIKIGGGSQVGPSSFSAINWAAGPYFLTISLFDGVSSVSMGSQQLVSVPFALYAQSSGNSGTTYSASTNVTINPGNVLDLTNTGVTPGVYGTQGLTNSTIPDFSVDSKGRITTVGEYTANVSGDIGGTLDNQTVNKLKGVPLSATSPANGQVLQYDGTSWAPANVGVGGVTNISTNAPLTGGPITSTGTISMLPSGVTPGTYGNSPSTVPVFSVDAFGRVTSAGTYPLPASVTTINTAAPLAGGPITSSGTISLTPSGVTPGAYGGTLNSIPVFTVDTYGRLTNAGTYSLAVPASTLNGDVKGTFLSNTVTALQGFSVSATTPTAGQLLQFMPPGIWTPTTPPVAPAAAWIKSGSTVTLGVNADLVGIGTSSPMEKLQIETPGATRASIISPVSSNGALWFGSPTSHSLGMIGYDNASNQMNFGTNGTLGRIRLFGNGDIAFGGTITPNPIGAYATFCKPGPNYTKVLIAGGDPSNTYGGILTLAENDYATQGFSMKMDAGANKLFFTNDVNGTSPVVCIGGYAGVNPGMMIGTGFMGNNPPVNGLLVQGNVGIGTTAPANLLHVNGGVTITNGTQALGRVLTSDASGNSTWAPVSTVTTAAFLGQNLASVGSVPVSFGSPLTAFTKQFADTKIEVTVQTMLHANDLVGTNSVRYEIRLSGTSGASTTGQVDYFKDNNNSFSFTNFDPAYFTAFFAAIPVGSYNVEIWAYAVNAGGTASNVSINNGNFIGNVIIKEFR